jgi:Cdc6-like AAA superfamily ATPase
MSRQSILANAFHPGTELDDPELFAGRRAQVVELTKALHSSGSCPIIYGDRGLGKSSLALQVQRIAMGDPSLLELQDAEPEDDKEYDRDPTLRLYDDEDDYSPAWAFSDEDSYLAFYIACSDSTTNTNAILQRLINSLSSVEPRSSSGASQLVDRTTRKRITVKLCEVEATRKYEVPPSPPDYSELTIEEKLQTAVRRLVDTYVHRIILIIDELDRVRDTTGLASFIKISSSHDLTFLLVGIAQNVSNLLSDHQSIERMAVPVEVPRMNKHELGQIVERAMRKLRDQGIAFKFEPEAKAELAKVASGFRGSFICSDSRPS